MNYVPSFFRPIAWALVLSTVAAMPALASGDHGAHGKPTVQTGQSAAAEMTDGEVRRVDKEGGKLTLRHAEIKSLDMPSMTMVFVVKDKAMLDRLKAGDKVKFKAVNDAGRLTVTEIQTAP